MVGTARVCKRGRGNNIKNSKTWDELDFCELGSVYPPKRVGAVRIYEHELVKNRKLGLIDNLRFNWYANLIPRKYLKNSLLKEGGLDHVGEWMSRLALLNHSRTQSFIAMRFIVNSIKTTRVLEDRHLRSLLSIANGKWYGQSHASGVWLMSDRDGDVETIVLDTNKSTQTESKRNVWSKRVRDTLFGSWLKTWNEAMKQCSEGGDTHEEIQRSIEWWVALSVECGSNKDLVGFMMDLKNHTLKVKFINEVFKNQKEVNDGFGTRLTRFVFRHAWPATSVDEMAVWWDAILRESDVDTKDAWLALWIFVASELELSALMENMSVWNGKSVKWSTKIEQDEKKVESFLKAVLVFKNEKDFHMCENAWKSAKNLESVRQKNVNWIESAILKANATNTVSEKAKLVAL